MGGLFGGGQTMNASEYPLAGLSIQSSSYGKCIPLLWGKTRITGNLIWYGDFVAIPHTSTQSSGGKGGGGSTSSSTAYSYQSATAIGLCEGPVTAVTQCWASKEKRADFMGLAFKLGTYPQTPWGYLTTNHAGQDLGYNGLCYGYNAALDLGSSAYLPNFSFEIKGLQQFGGGIDDANPKDVISDFLTNAKFGAGFPSAKLGSLTQYSNYCVANGIFISPAMETQQDAQNWLSDILQMTNSEVIWSERTLKFIPHGDSAATGNGATYTPNITPQYDLTDDDFIDQNGSDPVIGTRKTTADAFNQVTIEYKNRAADYNIEIVEVKDQANIEQFGLRAMSTIQMHAICDRAIATKIAQLVLQRALYIRNEYEFHLGWRYALLEPMDIVTITDAGLGLDKVQVRIIEIEEDENGDLLFKAEEFPFGIATPATFSTQAPGGYSMDFNVPAVSTAAHVIFEAPIELCNNGFELWLGAAATGNWGGCDIYVSSDNATYKRVGSIYGAARIGVLSQILPVGSDPDITDTLAVDLTVSGGLLYSGTQADADSLNTLCYVDGELVSVKTATQTALNKYNLNYLRRGAYNTTNSLHAIGAKFARVDDAFFKFGYTPDQIGNTVYFKFPAFNIYGGGYENLATATAYTHVISGPPAPPGVTNFNVRQNWGSVVFTWNMAATFGLKGFDIRYAAQGVTDWNTMIPLTESAMGTEMTNASVPAGAWVFAIRARDLADQLSPTIATYNLAVTNESNVVLSSDESSKGWPGTVNGFIKHPSGVLVPDDQHTAAFYGWEVFDQFVPTPVATCTYSSSAYDLAIDDTLRVYSLIQAIPGPGVSGTPTTSFAVDSWLTGQSDPNVWTSWTVGALQVRYLRGRIIATPGSVPSYLNAFNINAEALVSSKELTGSLTAAAGGTAVTFSEPYHLPPFVAASYGGSGAFIATASNITTTGFTAHIFNTSGTNVGGTPFNWKSSGV